MLVFKWVKCDWSVGPGQQTAEEVIIRKKRNYGVEERQRER